MPDLWSKIKDRGQDSHSLDVIWEKIITQPAYHLLQSRWQKQLVPILHYIGT